MLRSLTAIFVTIATIYILVVGVSLPLPTNHKKFLKNDFFLGTLMFFLSYYYTGNVLVTLLAIFFYFYFKRSEFDHSNIKPKNFLSNLFYSADDMTDDEYKKLSDIMNENENENELVREKIDNSNITNNIINKESSTDEYVNNIVNMDLSNGIVVNKEVSNDDLEDNQYKSNEFINNEEIENTSIPSNNLEDTPMPSYNLEDNNLDSNNLKTKSDEKCENMFEYKNFKNQVKKKTLLSNKLSKKFKVEPLNNFSKKMNEYEYLNKTTEHFSEIQEIKNKLKNSENLDTNFLPYEKNNTLVSIEN